MPLPHNGSTAPAITSPDLAWPAKPLARPSPLSTPSSESYNHDYPSSYPSRQASTSTTTSSPSDIIRRSGSIKGKERAVESFELRIHSDNNEEEELQDEEGEENHRDKERNYGPPKKPLPPHQLGRIAQSFGIIIPNLPQPPSSSTNSEFSSSSRTRRPSSPTSTSGISPILPTSSSSSRGGRLSPLFLSSQPPTRSSPFLLSVIPPLCLLPPQSSNSFSSEEIQRRNKKWKRGKLLPLQPTLGSMLVCIAREYGLPSTIGIYVYLVLPNQPKTKLTTRRGERSNSSDDENENESNYSNSDNDEPNGPQISSSTWSTLFSTHLVQLASGLRNGDSRSSTPSQTPLKSNESYTNDDYPLSPLSMSRIGTSNSQPQSSNFGKYKIKRSKSTEPPELSHSHSSNLSTSSSSVILPPTPTSLSTGTGTNYTISSSLNNPIVGTIEFDIDLDEARWFENYKSNRSQSQSQGLVKEKGGKHKRSLTSEGGIKELNLVNKVGDIRPRFLRELDTNTNTNRPSPEKQYLKVIEPSEIKSTSASLNEFINNESEEEEEEEIETNQDLLQPEQSSRVSINDLLASPIELSPEERVKGIEMDQNTRLQVQEILDKRGSGLVMAEQLDDLEKMMRQLSPREIRLTSPRMLTPRMAAKVANLTLPAVPKRSTSKNAPTSSPLAGSFTSPNPNLDSDSNEIMMSEDDRSQPNSARSNGTFGSTINLIPDAQPRYDQSKQRVEDHNRELDGGEQREEQFQPPRPAWPAVKHSSPGSPTINEYFSRPNFPTYHQDQNSQHGKPQSQRNVSSPAAISSETLQRMKDEQDTSLPNINNKTSEWIPRRPNRPPSPKLEIHQNQIQNNLSHTLSPEFVDFLHRSPPQTVNTNASPGVDNISSPGEVGRKRNRSGSISLKGLRNQMSSKNLSQMWKSGNGNDHHDKDKDIPSPPLPNGQKETIGLFKGGLPSNENDFSSYTGLRDNGNVNGNGGGIRSVSSPIPMQNSANSTHTDFGPPLQLQSQQDESTDLNKNHNSSGSGGKSKFTSRIWGFRNHSDKIEKDRSSKSSSKRNPSIDGSSIKISDPIKSSFIHNDSFDVPNPNSQTHSQQYQQQASLGHGRFPSYGQPNSPNNNPASPRSIKRKPVPGQVSGSNAGGNGGSGLDNDDSLVKNSMSLNSMASFVLEDAPKGRRGLGPGGMLGQAQ